MNTGRKIGSIGYCAITVRFDIAYAVSVLSRHLAKPCKKVVLAAKRVIKYLRFTRDMAIIWSAQSDSTVNWKLTGSVDASFANCQMTRRSHGGWINFFQSGASILEEWSATERSINLDMVR